MDPPPTQLVPPPLPRARTIALPPLSPNIPILIHILITYSLFTTPLIWDIALPPSTARLIDGRRLLHDVAVVPMLSSFTIRISEIARPIVVFPVEMGQPIRIIDILRAVYNAVRVEALEDGAGARNVPVYRTSNNSYLAFDSATTAEAQVIQAYLRNRSQWGGLSESVDEHDVWDLHLMEGPARRISDY